MRKNMLELSYKGETNTVNEWSRKLGIHKNTLYKRIESGLATEEILSVKSLKNNRDVNDKKFVCPICKNVDNLYMKGMCRNCYTIELRGYKRVFCKKCGNVFHNSKNKNDMCLDCRVMMKPVMLITKRMVKNYVDNIIKDEHKPIIELLNRGKSMAEIGREIGISRQRVHQVVKKYKKV